MSPPILYNNSQCFLKPQITDLNVIIFIFQLPNDTLHFNVDWRRSVYNLTSYIQFFYVSVVALVLIVDAVGKYFLRLKMYFHLS